MKKKPGTYALVLQSGCSQVINIGKLGNLEILQGYYMYIGSAFGPGGIRARISHHRRISPNPHWHIDYLRKDLKLLETWYTHDPEHREHQWSELINSFQELSLPHKKFGASDCACESHLFFSLQKPSYFSFCQRLHSRIDKHAPLHLDKLSE